MEQFRIFQKLLNGETPVCLGDQQEPEEERGGRSAVPDQASAHSARTDRALPGVCLAVFLFLFFFQFSCLSIFFFLFISLSLCLSSVSFYLSILYQNRISGQISSLSLRLSLSLSLSSFLALSLFLFICRLYEILCSGRLPSEGDLLGLLQAQERSPHTLQQEPSRLKRSKKINFKKTNIW